MIDDRDRELPAESAALLTLTRRAAWLLGAAAALVYFAQAAVIAHFAVDVPFADEWEAFRPGALPRGLTWEWLIAAHNEHRIVPTKLLTWVQLQLTGLDLRVSILVTYAFFGAAAGSVLLLIKRATPTDVLPYALWFTVFLFSPINYENLGWGFQSQFHIYLLLLAAAALLLFGQAQTWPRVLAGAALTALAVYSFSSGVSSAVVLVAAYGPFKLLRHGGAAAGRRAELSQLLAVASGIGVAVTVWVLTFQRIEGHGALALPTTATFWNHFLNVIALGFGAKQVSAPLGALCLLLILVPSSLLLVRHRREPGAWMIAAMVGALLAAQATISLGRGSFGPLQAKESRYSEYGLVLLLLSSAAIAWTLRGTKVRLPLVAALWLLCFGSFWKEWTVDDYRAARDRRTAGLECLRKARAPDEPVVCPQVYPWDVTEQFRGAQAVNASFLRAR